MPVEQASNSTVLLKRMEEAHERYNEWLYYVIVLCAAIVFSFV